MKWIMSAAVDEWVARAGEAARRRINHNIHEKPADPVQRLFVAARRDSYFRPHRHSARWELAVVIRGRFDVIAFDDAGVVTARHTWLPATDDAVFLEIKPGPYDPQTAAAFAAWSPAEGAPEVAAFTAKLRRARAGDSAA